MEQVKVIVKREYRHDGWGLLLFFPEMPANHGKIVCWDGCHNEVHMQYYWSLKNPREHEEKTVERLLKAYVRSGPPFDQELVRVKRDSEKMRRERWGR